MADAPAIHASRQTSAFHSFSSNDQTSSADISRNRGPLPLLLRWRCFRLVGREREGFHDHEFIRCIYVRVWNNKMHINLGHATVLH